VAELERDLIAEGGNKGGAWRISFRRGDEFNYSHLTEMSSASRSRFSCGLDFEGPLTLNCFRKSGGDDETRTRDLCRDRTFFNRWPTQNLKVTCAVVGNRWLHWAGLARFCSTICSTTLAHREPRGPARAGGQNHRGQDARQACENQRAMEGLGQDMKGRAEKVTSLTQPRRNLGVPLRQGRLAEAVVSYYSGFSS
jgi:hypothetical protein